MKIFVQFDDSFDYFLASPKNGCPFKYRLNRKASVKDIIESFGVPHTEVGHITYGRKQTDFSFLPSFPGLLNVQCIEPPFQVLSPTYLRPIPLKQVKFIADANVIKLGRLLILMGFDVRYSSSFSDREIANIAQAEARIVLTRDTDLLKRKKIIFAKRIKADFPYPQLIETIHFFGLQEQISFFSRCATCNRRLVEVSKDKVIHLLEPKTKKNFDTFSQCPQCNNVYWKGSHFDNIKKMLSSMGISWKNSQI